ILRFVGLVYLVAFAVFIRQGIPLIGHDGLTPADAYLAELSKNAGSMREAFLDTPTLFLLGASDRALLAVAWIGAGIAFLVACGLANAIALVVLWVLYMS